MTCTCMFGMLLCEQIHDLRELTRTIYLTHVRFFLDVCDWSISDFIEFDGMQSDGQTAYKYMLICACPHTTKDCPEITRAAKSHHSCALSHASPCSNKGVELAAQGAQVSFVSKPPEEFKQLAQKIF